MTTHTNTLNTPNESPKPQGVWTDRIAGRYRAIPVRQLVMAWWCYQEGHISFRQLRVYMAAHEMAERRRYTKPGGRTKPSYSTGELKALVGGRGSDSADAALSADIRRLARIGLVSIAGHAIGFAEAIDEIALDDVSGFHDMLEKVPHQRRTVPVPRRVIRAMAAGFTRGMTAVVLATLIRSLFWHKAQGAFRTDGRTKREWIADVFGVSLRSVTEGRARLIDLGWLVPQETSQFLLNRYGAHDQVNTDWSAADAEIGAGEASVAAQVESASLSVVFRGESASPLNRSLPQEGNQFNNRTSVRPPKLGRAGPSGVLIDSTLEMKKAGHRPRPKSPSSPNIRNVVFDDLNDIHRLLELHTQAVGLGLSSSSQAGLLDFVCFAERARSKGKKAGALFFWLVNNNKTEFITQSDEDQASRRLRELMNGPSVKPQQRWGGQGEGAHPELVPEPEFTDDERLASACIRAAQRANLDDPFYFARIGKGWSRDRWDKAV